MTTELVVLLILLCPPRSKRALTIPRIPVFFTTPVFVDVPHCGSTSLPSSEPQLKWCQSAFLSNIQQNLIRSCQTSLDLPSYSVSAVSCQRNNFILSSEIVSCSLNNPSFSFNSSISSSSLSTSLSVLPTHQ
ncbi:hypothetical protein L211DRAFT_136569 [Terfezia boudieri ATCC MYA-4762]|uniref:Secreted protein n=1 Tax=Terfezia boudieri ATCC MYA-4762 TaxID=1051890 RepID=A0A3N4LTT8_9PEZI|nr:hypothetical protein L211DRAFT_136569 [Terfezia boudieri ATCC MYA-4762]